MTETEKGIEAEEGFTIRLRKLPHWEQAGSVYFVTFTTANDFVLDDCCRDLVLGCIKFHQNSKYELYACVVMPEHLHLVVRPLEKGPKIPYGLSEIMHSIKSYSAKQINKAVSQTGQVWLKESYDRIVRDDAEFLEKMNYIVNNPLKKGLAEKPEDYRWLYLEDRECLKP